MFLICFKKKATVAATTVHGNKLEYICYRNGYCTPVIYRYSVNDPCTQSMAMHTNGICLFLAYSSCFINVLRTVLKPAATGLSLSHISEAATS